MADESDVEAAMVTAIAAAIYPTGTGAPPVGGYSCRIARGAPNAEALNADLAAGTVNVHVTLVPKMGRNTTRYGAAWQTASTAALPLSVTLTGAVATFAGVGAAGVVAGAVVRRQAYAYATTAADTPGSVASALAALIPGASATGAALTLPATGGNLFAAVYGAVKVNSEQRRQEQGFTVTIQAPTPDARTAVAVAIDTVMAQTVFLTLADGSAGRVRFMRTEIDDVPSRANLWRRILTYTVEFGTTITQTAPEMIFGTLTVNNGAGASVT